MTEQKLILAIESSCDETAASVYDITRGVLSSSVFSQIELHKKYGGVVPEIASRSHLQKINTVVAQALSEAGVTLEQITAFGVVNAPGLPGALLVGVCFAKALAVCAKKPIVAINHLEGHVFSSFLENQIPFPHLCLVASGGHTGLYLVRDFGDYTLLGRTLDDAAGEAFDKTAKLLDLPYPGGPVLERLASLVNFGDFLHYPRNKQKDLDFSFSGLKTAVLYDLVKRGLYNLSEKKLVRALTDREKQEISSSLLVCIADTLVDRIARACELYPEVKAVTFVGGVASNTFLRECISAWAETHQLAFFVPSRQYCTDNAAMAAFVAQYRYAQNKFSDEQLDIAY